MFKDTQNGTTHVVCNNRLTKEGGKAKCCECEPHDDCNLGQAETHKGENWRKGYQQGIDSEKARIIGAIENLHMTTVYFSKNGKAEYMANGFNQAVEQFKRIINS